MISVNFTSDVENVVATEHLYQWDNGQKLKISGVGTNADIHFANKKSEKALVVTPTITSGAMVAFIPNSLLAEPYPILAYVYVPSDNGSKTIKSVTIYVEARKQPSDFVLEEDEGITTVEAISQRVNAIMSSIQTDYNNFKNTIRAELDEMKNTTTIPNADTLDGKHASEFSQNKVITTLDEVNNPNLESGIYSVENVSMEFPYGSNGSGVRNDYFVLIVNQHRAIPGYGSQIAIPYTNGGMVGVFYRNCAAGTWNTWKNTADGGNADTLDGKHVSDLFQKSEGLRSGNTYSDIFSTTLTSDHACWNKHCFVVGQSTNPDSSDYIDNAPEINSALWYEVFTCGINDGNRAYQIAFGCFVHQRKTFIRYKHDSVWSDWKNIADGGNANTANTAGTLATTPTNVCLRNISFGTADPQVTDSSAEGYVAPGALYGQYV